MPETYTYQQLTLKQKRFVDAYTGKARGDAKKAAILAGYSKTSAKQIGSEVRKHPAVAYVIDERMQAESMSSTEVLWHLNDIARGSFDDFIAVGGSDLSPEAEQLIAKLVTDADLLLQEIREEGGLPIGLPEKIEAKREELQTLAEKVHAATHTKPWVYDMEKAERLGLLHLIAEIGTTEKGATKLKLQSRLEALKLLGQFHKLFTDRVEHTGPGGGPLVITEVVIEMPADEEDPDAGAEEPFPD